MFVGSVRSTYPQDPGASLEMEHRLAVVEETHRFAGFRCQKALLEGIHLSEAHNRQETPFFANSIERHALRDK